MNKLTVAVIFGSRSSEHDVSIITAISSIIKPLESSGKYQVIPVYIDKTGRWFSHPKLKDIKLYSSGDINNFLLKLKPVSIRLNGSLEMSFGNFKNKYQKIDVVFPATHGTHGEDGELMGMLQLLKTPTVGCDMSSSVLAMDKALAKIITSAAGILTSEFKWFYDREFRNDQANLLKKLLTLPFPLFVKPAHLGSSIAITKVKTPKELVDAIELAAHYDNKIVVERAVENLIELTLPIIGNYDLKPALLEQPLVKEDDFFDFDLKYMRGGKKGKTGTKGAQGYSQIPANIPASLSDTAIKTALDVYSVLGCSGIARVDMLVDNKTKKVYFNEVNPLPGGLYEHNWRQSGKSSVELVDELVDLSIKRHEELEKLTTSFETNFLKQF